MIWNRLHKSCFFFFFLSESSKKSIKGKIFFNAKKTKIPQLIQKKRLNNLKIELKEQNVNNFSNVDMRY